MHPFPDNLIFVFMNMLTTLDYFANHPVVMILTSILIFILIYLILFRIVLTKLFPAKKSLQKINILILFIVIPAVLTVPVFGTLGAKYGKATAPPAFTAHDTDFLYVMSPVQKTGKSVYRNHRLHKIDLKTGGETNRFLLTRNLDKYAWAVAGEILWVEFPSEKKLTGINITNGDKKIIDEKYLQSLDPSSRSTGIQNFTVDFSKPQVHVFRKNGTDTILHPFDMNKNSELVLYTKNENQMNSQPDFILSGTARKKLELNGQPILPEKFWINGQILSNDTTKKCLIIAGYQTTENDQPVVDCYNYELKNVWSISSPAIPDGEIGNAVLVNDSILICVGNAVLSIHLQTGKLNWCIEI